MSTRASVDRHPLHPRLIVFPLGLWIFAFVCYVVYMANGVAAWRVASLYAMAGGIIGAVPAAVPGLIDLLTLRGSGAWSIGMSHRISSDCGTISGSCWDMLDRTAREDSEAHGRRSVRPWKTGGSGPMTACRTWPVARAIGAGRPRPCPGTRCRNDR